MMASCSTDGLINIFDLTEDNEDDALQSRLTKLFPLVSTHIYIMKWFKQPEYRRIMWEAPMAREY